MNRHVPKLLEGVKVLPGDPMLRLAPFFDSSACVLEKVELDTFGARPSSKDTFCLGFKLHDPALASAKGFQEALKAQTTVWVNFPYLREGMILAIADEETRIDILTGLARKHTTHEVTDFHQKAATAQTLALRGAKIVGTGGMKLEEVNVMILVKPLSSMIEDRTTGLRRRSFASDSETWIPAALCVLENTYRDPRFMDSPPVPITERFPKGLPVICVQATGYGMLGTVEDYTPDNKILVKFPTKAAKQIEFGHVIATSMADTYVSISRSAQVCLHPTYLTLSLSSPYCVVGRRALTYFFV